MYGASYISFIVRDPHVGFLFLGAVTKVETRPRKTTRPSILSIRLRKEKNIFFFKNQTEVHANFQTIYLADDM